MYMLTSSALGGDRGWIINISSILGLVGMSGASAYAATKGAVLQMTKVRPFEVLAFLNRSPTDVPLLLGHRARVCEGQDPRQQHPPGLHRDEHARAAVCAGWNRWCGDSWLA